jgi:hypothetical protein
VAVTIRLVVAESDDEPIVQTAPPATLPSARGAAGARTLEQRMSRAQAIVRAAVEEVGEADSTDVAAEAPVRYRIIRVLHGTLPGGSRTLRSPVVASIIARSPAPFAVGKEQILFLDQIREENGQLIARQLSANYDSAPGRLDETEQQILEISRSLNPAGR